MNYYDNENTIKAIAACVLIVICLFVAWLIFGWTEAKIVTLKMFSWSYEVKIEDYLPRYEGKWCPAPAGAYNITRSRRKSGSHEECSGIGSKRKCTSVSDYDDWCDYTIDRWAYARSVFAKGKNRSDPAPYKPDFDLSIGDGTYGQERESTNIQIYALHLATDDKEYVCAVGRDKWDSLRIDTTWQIKVRRLLDWPVCDSMKEEIKK